MIHRSPCLDCERAKEDKNKCLEQCDNLKEYQEKLLRQSLDARRSARVRRA